jgi:hypothetical protein
MPAEDADRKSNIGASLKFSIWGLTRILREERELLNNATSFVDVYLPICSIGAI